MRALLVALALLIAPSASAQLRLPVLLSDGAVLQRHHPIPVWGWADPGASVTVRLGGARLTAEAGADGRWRVHAPALAVAVRRLRDDDELRLSLATAAHDVYRRRACPEAVGARLAGELKQRTHAGTVRP